jgi:FixJ family two-component response regulator
VVVTQQTPDDPTVYVVDDSLNVCEGLQSLFQSAGLRGEFFKTTAEFLANARPDVASCLILDVRLPGMSGLDLQLELARLKIDIPIIFITSHADVPTAVRAMKAGAVEFLSMPVRDQDILDAVRIALGRDQYRRERSRKTAHLRERYGALSDREREVMKWVCAGLMNKQAAAKLGLSEISVKVHRHNLMKKLGATSLADLVRMADKLQTTAD